MELPSTIALLTDLVNASEHGFCSRNDLTLVVDVCIRELENIPAPTPAQSSGTGVDEGDEGGSGDQHCGLLCLRYTQLLLAVYRSHLSCGDDLGLGAYRHAEARAAVAAAVAVGMAVAAAAAAVEVTLDEVGMQRC